MSCVLEGVDTMAENEIKIGNIVGQDDEKLKQV